MREPNERRGGGQRLLRVGEELRHALSDIILRGQLKDPALSGRSITVTEVRVAPDLKSASVFVTPLGGADAPELVEALARAQPYLRARLAEAVRLRHAPALRFRIDTRFDATTRVESLLDSAPVRRDLDPGGGRDDGA